MAAQEEKALIQVALDLKIIDSDQAEKVWSEKDGDPDSSVGEILKKLDIVSDEQYLQLSDAFERFQKNHPDAFKAPEDPIGRTPQGDKSGEPFAAGATSEKSEKKDLASSDDIYIALEQRTLDVPKLDEGTPASARIISCPKCGMRHSIYGFEKGKIYKCKSCGTELDTGSAISDVAAQETVAFKAAPSSDADDPFIGKEIGGCKVLSKLGQGGMGAVYKAKHLSLAKIVAVKILPPGTNTQAQHDRFVREAQTAAQLEHTNVVQVHNVAEEAGHHFIIMQYVEGRTLSQIVRQTETPDIKKAMVYIRDAARGIEAAHKKHMVHRDIKPDNIMVTSEGEVKVMDFGLAKSLESGMEITRTGQVLGTPYYMSPEQCGDGVVDAQSDIYSLGVTFYYLVTGQRPFTGDTPLNVMMKHINEDMPDPRQFEPDTEPGVITVLARMMAKDKKERYQSAREVINDIDRLLSGMSLDPGTAAFAAARTRAAARKSRKPLIAVIAIVAVVVVAAVVIFSLPGKKPSSTGTGGTLVVSTSAPSTGDTAFDKFKRMQALEKEAAVALVKMKQKAAGLAGGLQFDDAVAKFDSFPEKYRKTPSWDEVPAAKKDIEEQAEAEFGRAKKKAEAFAEANKFDDAIAGIALFKGVGVKGIGKRASDYEKSLDGRKQGYLEALNADDLRKEQEARLARADEFYREKKYAQAGSIYKELAESSIGAVSARAKGSLGAIALIEADAKEIFETAISEAKTAADAKRYDDAILKLKSCLTRIEGFPEYASDASARISGYETDLKNYWKTCRTEAGVHEKASRYKEARRIYGRFESGINPAITSEAALLGEACDRWIAYTDAGTKIEGEISAGSKDYKNFITVLTPFASSTDARIASLAKSAIEGYEKKLQQALISKYPDMCFVAAVTCSIGSNDAADSNPFRKVTLKAFFMDRYEVTNGQYYKFVKATGCKPPRHWKNGRITRGMEKHPVVNVSWTDAAAYAKWAGKRLPTAAEWEVAAGWDGKDARSRKFPWGDSFATGRANVNTSGTVAVGSFPRGVSPCGCMDMSGNVWEWTASGQGDEGAGRVTKGGSFYDKGLAGIAVTFSYARPVKTKRKYMGFRCAK